MFKSIYSCYLEQYYNMRYRVLSQSAIQHELCYLHRFDDYIRKNQIAAEQLTEKFINGWIATLKTKSSSVENEVIVVRQFLKYLRLSGVYAYIPTIPKVREDYIPYLFSDSEIEQIFASADNLIQKDKKADPYLSIEFPVILRLLYSCGLRIGETVKLEMSDVDLENGILRLINTKGNKHRLVPMSAEMTKILTNYCLSMGFTSKYQGWLFPSYITGDHILATAVKYKFEKILNRNKIVNVNRKRNERGPCLHCLRHVFAFKSFAKAESEGRHLDDEIPYLSIYLGHVGLGETEKYLKFSSELFSDSTKAFGDYMSELLPEVDNAN